MDMTNVKTMKECREYVNSLPLNDFIQVVIAVTNWAKLTAMTEEDSFQYIVTMLIKDRLLDKF